MKLNRTYLVFIAYFLLSSFPLAALGAKPYFYLDGKDLPVYGRALRLAPSVPKYLDLANLTLFKRDINYSLTLAFYGDLPPWINVGGELDLDVDSKELTGSPEPLRRGADYLIEITPAPEPGAVLYKWKGKKFGKLANLEVIRHKSYVTIRLPPWLLDPKKVRFKGFIYFLMKDSIRANYSLKPGGRAFIADGRDRYLPGWADIVRLTVDFKLTSIILTASFASLPPVPLNLPPTLGKVGGGWGAINVLDVLRLDSDGDGTWDYALELEHKAVRLGSKLTWLIRLEVFKRKNGRWTDFKEVTLRDLRPYERAYLSWLMGGLTTFNLRTFIDLSEIGIKLSKKARLLIKGYLVTAIVDYFPADFKGFVKFTN